MVAILEKPCMNAALHKDLPRAAPNDTGAVEHANAEMMVCRVAMAGTCLAGRAVA